eukprot:NODE_155_length_2892_cov_25.347559_g143_i0.p1 GENE.NODE_155_length_2892_cov_25.347559_g143_i0~~NODE_155_length_2892_cov_25.347559_g143_i0.p1  ORF type:complete len:526 (+),score=149.35 NODE_155_length_2892_cov_25.347559_g143_i0:1264-2841(+)
MFEEKLAALRVRLSESDQKMQSTLAATHQEKAVLNEAHQIFAKEKEKHLKRMKAFTERMDQSDLRQRSGFEEQFGKVMSAVSTNERNTALLMDNLDRTERQHTKELEAMRLQLTNTRDSMHRLETTGERRVTTMVDWPQEREGLLTAHTTALQRTEAALRAELRELATRSEERGLAYEARLDSCQKLTSGLDRIMQQLQGELREVTTAWEHTRLQVEMHHRMGCVAAKAVDQRLAALEMGRPAEGPQQPISSSERMEEQLRSSTQELHARIEKEGMAHQIAIQSTQTLAKRVEARQEQSEREQHDLSHQLTALRDRLQHITQTLSDTTISSTPATDRPATTEGNAAEFQTALTRLAAQLRSELSCELAQVNSRLDQKLQTDACERVERTPTTIQTDVLRMMEGTLRAEVQDVVTRFEQKFVVFESRLAHQKPSTLNYDIDMQARLRTEAQNVLAPFQSRLSTLEQALSALRAQPQAAMGHETSAIQAELHPSVEARLAKLENGPAPAKVAPKRATGFSFGASRKL